MFLAACVQLRCTTDIERNLSKTEALVRRAARCGAQFVATPENTSLLGPQFHRVDLAESLDGPIGQRLSALAAETGIHLLIGSVNEQRVDAAGQPDPVRCHNTSMLFGPDGTLVEYYRKIHLFDVDVAGGLSVRESDTICPGTEVKVAETPLGRIGMSICYDLRFPELYRAQVDAGADIICVPSAFTLTTGKDHWHAFESVPSKLNVGCSPQLNGALMMLKETKKLWAQCHHRPLGHHCRGMFRWGRHLPSRVDLEYSSRCGPQSPCVITDASENMVESKIVLVQRR